MLVALQQSTRAIVVLAALGLVLMVASDFATAQEPDVEVRGVAEGINTEPDQPLVIVRADDGGQVQVVFRDKGPLPCIAVGGRIRVLGNLVGDGALMGAVIDTRACPNPLAELAQNTPPLPGQAVAGTTVQIIGRVTDINSQAEYPFFLLDGEDGKGYQISAQDKFPLNPLSLGARVRVRGPKLDESSIGVVAVDVVERFEDNDNG